MLDVVSVGVYMPGGLSEISPPSHLKNIKELNTDPRSLSICVF